MDPVSSIKGLRGDLRRDFKRVDTRGEIMLRDLPYRHPLLSFILMLMLLLTPLNYKPKLDDTLTKRHLPVHLLLLLLLLLLILQATS